MEDEREVGGSDRCPAWPVIPHPGEEVGGLSDVAGAAGGRGSGERPVSRSHTGVSIRTSQRGGEPAALSRGVTSRHLVSHLAALPNTRLDLPLQGGHRPWHQRHSSGGRVYLSTTALDISLRGGEGGRDGEGTAPQDRVRRTLPLEVLQR